MNCAIEMGSGAMIYTPSFIKVGSEVVRKGRHTDTQTARRSRNPTFIFSRKGK
jgi:hypothetical protein